MRTARLLGRDHHAIGRLAAIGEGPAAIALSRGGARKTYDHTEPNEDAALFAHARAGTLVAVADGHHGAAGAQVVIELLESDFARRWTDTSSPAAGEDDWRDEARRALAAANHAILADAGRRGLPPAPATLALVVARPLEGLAFWAGIGDSHVFAVGARRTTDVLALGLADRRTSFLGYESLDLNLLAERSASGVIPLDDVEALVLATDGLSERGIGVTDPADVVQRAAQASRLLACDLRALELARSVGEAALGAHRANRSGDNIASAAIWLDL